MARADREKLPTTLTTGEIAEYLEVSTRTIHHWVADRQLPAYTTPGGHYRFVRADLVRWLRDEKMPVPKELGG